jgi:hypothetical protein
MDKVSYWLEKGFVKVARIFESERLTQGVDVEFFVDKKDYKLPGVYLLAFKDEVIKIGQSANILSRINTQYKCISNLGNNRIRAEIREKYKSIDVYVFKVPKKDFTLLEYTFPINYQKGLEEAMLHDFYKKMNRIPVLNLQRN